MLAGRTHLCYDRSLLGRGHAFGKTAEVGSLYDNLGRGFRQKALLDKIHTLKMSLRVLSVCKPRRMSLCIDRGCYQSSLPWCRDFKLGSHPRKPKGPPGFLGDYLRLLVYQLINSESLPASIPWILNLREICENLVPD